jgi:hypothetical protein
MIRRCECERDKDYADYGGRGIRVCVLWRRDFAAFLAHIGPRPGRGYSLDRIDVNGHYEPGNVRWASQTEQHRNKRNNRLLTLNGVTKCVGEWAVITGINYTTLKERLRRGWSPERTLTTPVQSGVPRG